jgi:hypothetical protein
MRALCQHRHKLHKPFQRRIGRPLGPHQCGFAPGHGLAARARHAAVNHTGALELPHALGHPGHAQPRGHQVDDGLHLDGLLRHLGRAPRSVIQAQDGVVQRGDDAPRKDHQRLGQHLGQRQRGRAGQRVVVGQGQHQGLARHQRVLQAGGRKAGRMQHEARVNFAARQRLQLHARAQPLDVLRHGLPGKRFRQAHGRRRQRPQHHHPLQRRPAEAGRRSIAGIGGRAAMPQVFGTPTITDGMAWAPKA